MTYHLRASKVLRVVTLHVSRLQVLDIDDPVLQVRLGGRAGQSTALQRCSLEALPPMRSAVLVFDARDVALMRVKVPPLSGARLLRALPNILEDQLLQDPQACSFVPGPAQGDGERLVADRRVGATAFTGSQEVGRRLHLA